MNLNFYTMAADTGDMMIIIIAVIFVVAVLVIRYIINVVFDNAFHSIEKAVTSRNSVPNSPQPQRLADRFAGIWAPPGMVPQRTAQPAYTPQQTYQPAPTYQPAAPQMPVQQASVPQAAAPQAPVPRAHFCKSCGAPFHEGCKFCAKCGAKL